MNQEKINIVFVTTSLTNGGAQIQLLSFIQNLPANIYSHIVTIKNEGILAQKFKESNILVKSLNFRYKISLNGLLTLIKFIKNNKSNLVFTIGYGDSLFWGRVAARLAGVSIIYSSLHTFPEVGGEFTFINRLTNGLTSRFLPVATELMNLIVKKNNIKKNHVIPLQNGVENSYIHKILNDNFDYDKNILDLFKNHKHLVKIIQVGKLINYKNQRLSLRVIKKILEENNRIKFIFYIVGDGPDLEELQEFVRNNRLESYVKFTDQLSHYHCLQLISLSDIVILPSISEAFPNILIEASMLKKPIIASNVGGISEIVLHNKSGLLFPVNDVLTYKKYLIHLINNGSIRKQMGEAGSVHTNLNFTIHKKINKFLDILYSDLSKLDKSKRINL